MRMKLYNIDEVSAVVVDPHFDYFNWSDDIDVALNNGYDKSMPIVLDETGFIIDGNHRYCAFLAAGKIDEVVFCIVNRSEYNAQIDKLTESGDIKDLYSDELYYYQIVSTLSI